MARSTFVYVTYIRTTPEKLWSALTDAEFMKQYWFGMHCESQWTAGSSWKMVLRRRQHLRRRRDRRGRSAAAVGDPLAAPEQARTQGRRRVAMHDGTGAQRNGGQALHHPHHRARTLETHRGGVRRLAEDHLQPEVPAGDRLDSVAGRLPGCQAIAHVQYRPGRETVYRIRIRRGPAPAARCADHGPPPRLVRSSACR